MKVQSIMKRIIAIFALISSIYKWWLFKIAFAEYPGVLFGSTYAYSDYSPRFSFRLMHYRVTKTILWTLTFAYPICFMILACSSPTIEVVVFLGWTFFSYLTMIFLHLV